jgi:hypothetical protein
MCSTSRSVVTDVSRYYSWRNFSRTFQLHDTGAIISVLGVVSHCVFDFSCTRKFLSNVCWTLFRAESFGWLLEACSLLSIYIYNNGCMYVHVFVCSGITLERLERFRPNVVHIWLYVCVRILCMVYIYFLFPKHHFEQGGWCGRPPCYPPHPPRGYQSLPR